MLDIIAIEKKLGIDSSDKKWRGLKVFTVSFLIGVCGVIISFLGLESLGYWVMVMGWFGGCAGLVMHFYAIYEQRSNEQK